MPTPVSGASGTWHAVAAAMAVVLVVNDDADMLDTYESLLISMGHQPVTKMTVSSGPQTVREVGADALVVDLQRPDENEYGVRIIREVRADPETSDVPIILCTGASEAVRPLIPALEALDVPIVIKPFAVEDLEATLRDALKKRGERKGRGRPKRS
jgi:DNA-binding response OmpR family regulator